MKVKSSLLMLTAALLALPTIAQAQGDINKEMNQVVNRVEKRVGRPKKASKFRIVPMIGTQASTFAELPQGDGTTYSYRPEVGFAAAALVEYRWLRWLSFQSGVSFFQDGTTLDAEGRLSTGTNVLSSESLNEKAVSNWIGIPVLVKGNIRLSGFALYLKGGVTSAFLVSDSYIFRESQFRTGAWNRAERHWRTFNFYGTAGLGFEIPISRQMDIRAEGTYNRSLMSAARPASDGNFANQDIFTHSFGALIGVGYNFF